MKVKDIVEGGFYHDGKLGVREILAIGADVKDIPRVEYRILSAKVTQEYDHQKGYMVQVLGSKTSCNLDSFAAWAKQCLSPSDCTALLARLEAKRTKLAPGEKALMTSLAEEVDQDDLQFDGAEVSFDAHEMRSAKSLAKKGLVNLIHISTMNGGTLTLTKVGAGWILNRLAERTQA